MLPVSAISDAANKLRRLFLDQIGDLADVKQIRIGHPKDTFEAMESEKDKNHLNLFFYHVAYDGYPADGLSADPFYVRLYCLITAVGATKEGAPSAGENDLRLVGEVMRVLHQQPVLALDGGNGQDVAQLQIVPHPLNLDNLNHLWSTQGDTAYRLSVAYEMALAPIPLAEAKERSPRVGAVGVMAQGDLDRKPLPDGGFGIETTAPAVPRVAVDAAQSPDWRPHIGLVTADGKSLAYTLLMLVADLPDTGFLGLKVLVAGQISEAVDLVWETWSHADGAWRRSSATLPHTIEIDTMDPNDFDPTTAVDVDLPLENKGQATLYAERAWTRPDGVSLTLRSNPLLVTVYEAGP